MFAKSVNAANCLEKYIYIGPKKFHCSYCVLALSVYLIFYAECVLALPYSISQNALWPKIIAAAFHLHLS